MDSGGALQITSLVTGCTTVRTGGAATGVRRLAGRLAWAAGLLTAMLVLGGLPGGALAATDPGCTALGGDDSSGECRVTGPVTAGVITLGETLHILAGPGITVGPGGLELRITSGNFVMDDGSLIDGGNFTCPNNGRNITVTLDAGNVDLQTGSMIRSNGCNGGIHSDHHGGGVHGEHRRHGGVGGQESGTAGQGPGGGPITIKAGCDLTISDTGLVSSRGGDPGADLVHLEGCVVTIFGVVESRGAGHAVPQNPANSCSDGPTNSPRRNPVTRPGKPHNSTGCVEIWSGTTVLIDNTGTHRGEVNADIGTAGGTQGVGWIDILAGGDIEIRDAIGKAGFAVHANGGPAQNTDQGGIILIQTYGGDVIASGDALQADATTSGSRGGEIRVEADGSINFSPVLQAGNPPTGASVFARGDFTGTGFGFGGKIGPTTPTVPPIISPAPIRAFNGSLTWTHGRGDARPSAPVCPMRGSGRSTCRPAPR